MHPTWNTATKFTYNNQTAQSLWHLGRPEASESRHEICFSDQHRWWCQRQTETETETGCSAKLMAKSTRQRAAWHGPAARAAQKGNMKLELNNLGQRNWSRQMRISARRSERTYVIHMADRRRPHLTRSLCGSAIGDSTLPNPRMPNIGSQKVPKGVRRLTGNRSPTASTRRGPSSSRFSPSRATGRLIRLLCVLFSLAPAQKAIPHLQALRMPWDPAPILPARVEKQKKNSKAACAGRIRHHLDLDLGKLHGGPGREGTYGRER
ncbi:hypothetical protein B0T24DRAFT_150186 [Lasiosphaeria ovina]|uniref:Uncharacterized protein n=1 Tax=Lasiosphaeria ovina TaxID=92902 RepID=A0AAE0KM49_9PEZI|nr:hypothetical protein B0T24DRAFT_150186 [Lasiosphaeria ovina]